MRDLLETKGTYESFSELYERRHANRKVVQEMVNQFDHALTGSLILDVGCGPGWEAKTLVDLGYNVLAIDLVQSFLRTTADRSSKIHFARMDMQTLGICDGQVDGIWGCASFLHIHRKHAAATLREFNRVLAPSGVLMLSVRRGSGVERGNTYPDDRRRFTYYQPDELQELLISAGFDVSLNATSEWIEVLAKVK